MNEYRFSDDTEFASKLKAFFQKEIIEELEELFYYFV